VISRRTFVGALAGGLLAAPLTAEAQPAGKVWRIGYVSFDPAPGNDAPPIGISAFQAGLRDLGYVEGRNIFIEYRWANLDGARVERLLRDLVSANVDVIVTYATGMVRLAREVTDRVPIVCALCADMVGGGVVSSLARPGGNVTGLTVIGPDLAGKRIEFLKTVGVSRVMGLHYAPETFGVVVRWRTESEQAAQAMALRFEAARANTVQLLEAYVAKAAREQGTGLSFMEEPFYLNERRRIAALTLKQRVPTVFPFREHTEAGGMISYGVNTSETFRRAATYVDKILKGAKPADLPIEQPTKFELVINLKTAKALGLTIPPSLLARADEVLQ